MVQHRLEQRKAQEVKYCAHCGKTLPSRRSKFCSDTCRWPPRRQSRIWPRNCAHCDKPFIARHPRTVTCSPLCSRKRRNKSDDYHRWKRSKRRAVTADTDITPQQEAAMRRRARRCPLCGVYMTTKPMLPNSKQLDHIVPIGVGGTHTHGNVRVICRDCNLKRPKDGSDYTGLTTLWATEPNVVLAPKPAPKTPAPRIVHGRCSCGKEIHRSRTDRCDECNRALTIRAAEMRDAGMKWQEICDALSYSNTGSLYGRVMHMRSSEATKTGVPLWVF